MTAIQNQLVDLKSESQIDWEKFVVLFVTARFCRFSEEFISNVQNLLQFYPVDFKFYRIDIDEFPHFVADYLLVGTPAVVLVYRSAQYQSVHVGNFSTGQLAALIALALGELEKEKKG